VRDAPNWRWALLVRDWLRADAGARAEYLAVKRELAARFAADLTTAAYAEAKEPWFAAAAPRAEAWAASTGWRPPD
jgi:dephospho-CoA kinase